MLQDARRARQEARVVRMELAQSQTVRAQVLHKPPPPPSSHLPPLFYSATPGFAQPHCTIACLRIRNQQQAHCSCTIAALLCWSPFYVMFGRTSHAAVLHLLVLSLFEQLWTQSNHPSPSPLQRVTADARHLLAETSQMGHCAFPPLGYLLAALVQTCPPPLPPRTPSRAYVGVPITVSSWGVLWDAGGQGDQGAAE